MTSQSSSANMAASLLTIPPELREQILLPLVAARGTIELQYPIWADKTVFVPPIAQVCKSLRIEAIQTFYRANVFMWVIDPEAVRMKDSGVRAWFGHEQHGVIHHQMSKT